MLCLYAHVTLILAYYRPSAYRLRRVPYLLSVLAIMCTTGPSILDSTAHRHPVLLYRYLASVAFNATW